MNIANYQQRLDQQLVELKNQIIPVLVASLPRLAQQNEQALYAMETTELIELASQQPVLAIYRLLGDLKRVDAALCQIELGLFGMCCDCEEPIEESLLEADPCEQRCKACQSKYQLHQQSHRYAL
ncbi:MULTISPECIES: TraR/DksA C4-type zinc finger protein [Aliagarivorans]|uniref:TraR/DksA C4-type zinc finger protein n=1 Tax=Aliagarivorans TaxID=882379 RepID=UPI000410C273|nr:MULTISPECIES: TraR/DksA C4-type zinc finger protein [Aliagarivorans]